MLVVLDQNVLLFLFFNGDDDDDDFDERQRDRGGTTLQRNWIMKMMTLMMPSSFCAY